MEGLLWASVSLSAEQRGRMTKCGPRTAGPRDTAKPSHTHGSGLDGGPKRYVSPEPVPVTNFGERVFVGFTELRILR